MEPDLRRPAFDPRPAAPPRRWAWLALFGLGAFAAPLLGLYFFVPGPRDSYFSFPPPAALYIEHAGFSWGGFLLIALSVALTLGAMRWALGGISLGTLPARVRAVPRWGYAAGGALLLSWLFAWTRCGLLVPLQQHTFILLWISYIVAANALLVAFRGEAPLTSQPKAYGCLFALSAGFWWLFEWLNRFVQNWTYHNVDDFTGAGYFWFATLSSSTVLPSVYVTKQLVSTMIAPAGPRREWRLRWIAAACGTVPLLTAALALLVLLPVFPSLLYPTVWLSPLLLFLAIQQLGVRKPVRFDGVETWQWMLAGLWCGVLWELWNWRSLAKWIYHIPHAEAFHIFEMPLLGYAGYLPFGALCGLITEQFLSEYFAATREDE